MSDFATQILAARGGDSGALDSLFVRGDCELQSLTRPRTKGARSASDHVPLVAELAVLPPR